MLMYPEKVQEWFNFRQSVLILLSKINQTRSFQAFAGKEDGLKFSMLMYPNHLQKWLDSDQSLLSFLPFFEQFWISEMGHILVFRAFSGERMEGMA